MPHDRPPLIYADYNASTPIDPRVADAMGHWLRGAPANAGSRTHRFGQAAQQALQQARDQIAQLFTAEPECILFTSGATESNNLVLLGLAHFGQRHQRRHILASSIEHSSVLQPLDRLSQQGFEVEPIPVEAGGFVTVEAVRQRLRDDTLLVCVMHANNETGVLQPVTEIANLLDGSPTFLHVDASQTFGKEVETLRHLPCDFASLSGHKIYGPPGIGALYVRRRADQRCPLQPLMLGGGQERGLRPGTVPVVLAAGLGMAAELASHEYLTRRAAAARVKQDLLDQLAGLDFTIHGDPQRTQTHVLNLSFAGVDSSALVAGVSHQLAISSGAACQSASHRPSHVLTAMGLPPSQLQSAVRLAWGPGVDQIPAEIVRDTVTRLRTTRKTDPRQLK